ncbi:hypothetical protein EG329_001842 [Mollisiaceae sp. DMI_Dod_QoI]|nr:hypothetical protein EG329_001842 [Helotiales sp. DMI_Dod_QoI]
MILNTVLSFSLVFTTLCVPADAAWFRHGRFHIGHKRDIGAEELSESWYLASFIHSTTASESYTFSVPNASIIAPTSTSQGMVVTSIIPVYEVCNTPGSNTTSCSTIFETVTTTTCSTVLTYAFSQTTITDCSENITFSTQSSYALATTTIPSSVTPIQKRNDVSPPAPPSSSPTLSPTIETTTYVQSVVSYWHAPWQSLAANDPTNITLLVCTFDFYGKESCVSVQEVWIVHTEYVLVSTTSTLSISTSLPSDMVFLFAPMQSVTARAGNFTLSTQITYSSMVANATTYVSTLTSSDSSTEAKSNTRVVAPGGTQTSTTTSTTTITISGQPTTITMTLSEIISESQSITTLHSTTVVTTTVTVQPQVQRRVRERALAEAMLLA